MVSSFSSCPTEVVEHVASYLSLSDIRALRFVNRELMYKASEGHFRTYCTKKEVELRVTALRQLAEMVQPGKPGRFLEDLTITGVCYITEGLAKVIRTGIKPANPDDPLCIRTDELGNPRSHIPISATDKDIAEAKLQLPVMKHWQRDSIEELQSGELLQSLKQVFVNLRQHGRTSTIKHITLQVAVYRNTNLRLEPNNRASWRTVWEKAEQTFAVTIQALAQSHLTVYSLDTYSNLHMCSVQVYFLSKVVTDMLPANSLACEVLKPLRSLAVSFSNRVLPKVRDPGFTRSYLESDPDEEQFDIYPPPRSTRDIQTRAEAENREALERESIASDPRNFDGLAKLLSCTPTLEELKLYFYHLPYARLSGASQDPFGPLRQVSSLTTLCMLKKLALQGISAEAVSLLDLLRRNVNLCSVDLREIGLETKIEHNWSTIFDHLTSPDNRLSYVYLDNLFAGPDNSYILLEVPTEGPYARPPRMYFGPMPSGCGSLCLHDRDSVLQGIRFQLVRHWVQGCVDHSKWRVERRQTLGPPGR